MNWTPSTPAASAGKSLLTKPMRWVRRVHEETLALARTNPGRRALRDRIELVLPYVYLVFALLVGICCGVLLWRRA
jgi:hypothetical protein